MDYSFLISISDGDQEFISEFITTFEETTILQIEQLLELYEKKDFAQLGKLAHQIKPTGEMLGFESQNDIVMLNTNPEKATKEILESILNEAKEGLVSLKQRFSI